MGFIKRLFGGGSSRQQQYIDTQGLYFYVQCDNCAMKVRVRADKQHDLNRENGGYAWHKTIVDSRCFRPMRAVVYLDSNYEVTQATIEGGRFITKEEYDTLATTGTE